MKPESREKRIFRLIVFKNETLKTRQQTHKIEKLPIEKNDAITEGIEKPFYMNNQGPNRAAKEKTDIKKNIGE